MTKLIYSPECLDYEAPGHPESPDRLRYAYSFLKDKYEILSPMPAADADLLRVHSPQHLEQVRTLNFFDPDTPPCPNIDRYARLAAGAALRAAKARAFSLMRPPGHHAGRERVAGFCYFNNLAVAVKSTGLKTLILDVDGHHGDGTQAIFLGDDQVILISLHRSPWYPGTGLRSEQNCFNYPLRAFCGDEIYLKTLERALDRVAMHGIEQVAVSAGFDTFLTDDLASLGLSTGCYREIGRRIARLGLPTFAVLEGGYDVQHLGENIQAFLQGFNSSGSPAGASGP